MNQLRHWDEVAYVRFASVYRHFTDATDFMEEIRHLLDSRDKTDKDSKIRLLQNNNLKITKISECYPNILDK